MLVSVTQMMGNVSDQNKQAFESIVMQLILRQCELANIDISAGLASTLNEQLVMQALESTMGAVAEQQNQIGQLQQAMGMSQQGMPMPPEVGQTPVEMGQMPPEMGQLPPEMGQAPMEMGQPPMPEEMSMEAGGMPPDMMATMGEPTLPEEEPMV